MKNYFHWQAPEFHFYQKDLAWYFKFSLIGLILASIFIYLGASQKQFSYYLAAAVVLAAILALFSQSAVQPKATDIAFSQDGVEITGRKYLWPALKNFWFSDHTISFDQKKRFSFPLQAMIGEADPIKIREFLLQYLPEKTNGDQAIFEKINRLFKL